MGMSPMHMAIKRLSYALPEARVLEIQDSLVASTNQSSDQTFAILATEFP